MHREKPHTFGVHWKPGELLAALGIEIVVLKSQPVLKGISSCHRVSLTLYFCYNIVETEEAAMIKKLTAVGNSYGLIIERPILDLLDIDKETPLEVRTDGEALIIRPQRKNRSARINAAAERMMKSHDETLRKLAK